ncbi:hypothetical protein K1719_018256 [Acacia pycnantha]|nr:hypothetical protein K1719_018256 [Acacia pycnantha]
MDEDFTSLIQRVFELARNLESNLSHISDSPESVVRCIDEIVMTLNAAKGKLLPVPVVSSPREDEANKHEIIQQHDQVHQIMASSLLQQWLSGGHSQFVPMSQLQAPARTTSAPHLMGASRDVDASAEADAEASPSSRRRRSSSIRKDEGEKTTIMVPAVQFGNTDVPPEDGYTWRKYGQKEILGSNFPRSYFRCTHQKLYQCPAKKQVQRLDNNPNIFAVTYRGSHTCHMSSTAPSSSVPPQLMISSQVQSHDITHISATTTTTSSQLSPPSSSIPCWLSSVHLGLLAGGSSGGGNPAGAESGGGGAGPSTSRFGGVDYPVADMADAMFNSGSSSGNSMESLFASADDKGEAGDNKKS